MPAPAFVVANRIEAASGTSASLAVSSVSGNGLIACCEGANSGSATTPAPTISGGNTWTADASGAFGAAGVKSIQSINHSKSAGGSVTYTVSCSVANGIETTLLEFSFNGSGTDGTPDATAPAIHTGNGLTASTNSVSNVTAAAVFVACVGDDDSGNTNTVSGTSTGWNYNPSSTDRNDGQSFSVFGTGYKIRSTTGAETSSWSLNTNFNWGCLIAVYKATGGAVVVPPPVQPYRLEDLSYLEDL